MNESDDSDVEFLSDGITEGLINRLSQLSSLRVIARFSAFRYKNTNIDPRQAAIELGVRAVVTGRVSSMHNRILISTGLVDVERNAQIWGAQYNQSLADLLTLQEQMSKQISASLRVTLTGDQRHRLEQKDTLNPEAYELFLRGRYAWNLRTVDGLRRALGYFERATTLDGDYAKAYAAIAESYVLLGWYGFVRPREAMPKAKVAALRALELNDGLAEAYAALGNVRSDFDWDPSSAEHEFKRSLRLNPGYPTAHHWYGAFLAQLSRFDEAIDEIQLAERLDPYSPSIRSYHAWTLYFARRYQDALSECKTTIDLDPYYAPALSVQALTYLQLGSGSEALDAVRAALPFAERDFLTLAASACVFAQVGDKADALHILAQLKGESTSRYVSPTLLAFIYTNLGEMDQAFAHLEEALVERCNLLLYVPIDPLLKDLRKDTRYAELLSHIIRNATALSRSFETPAS